MILRMALLGGALLTAAACDDAPAPEPVVVELGSGVDDFVAVADGETLRITEGLQGGYHIFGSVRTEGIEAWDAEIDLNMYQGDVRIGGARYIDDFLLKDGALVYSGVTVFLFENFTPESVDGTPTLMTVKVTDSEGRIGSSQMTFVPKCCDYLP